MTLDYALTVFITIITIVDPIGMVPVYIPIANRFPVSKHTKIILMSTTIALIISTIFLFIGKHLFKYLQINYNAIYIVGGILLFMTGLDMINARPRRTRSSPEEEEEALTLKDVSVFPLAIPMLSGPGILATTIMFSSRFDSAMNYLIIFISLVISFAITGLLMYFSSALIKILGQTGINVMDRIMGIILCSLAVQFVLNALSNTFLSGGGVHP
ncbi:MAG: NAAT family transporter [Oligoflexia bacterium]|nr:NAAT family transporter [Oligoflexia bacterium]